MRNHKKTLLLFLLGAGGYSLIEILWRGFTHWTMSITGGLCFCGLCRIHRDDEKNGLIIKCLKGTMLITAIEFLVGCLVNRKLRWNVWDYSNLPCNFKGQVCLLYSVLWFLLCIPLFLFMRLIDDKSSH